MNTSSLNIQNAPEMVLTVDGWMRLEDEYIPRVCTRENGAAPLEAIKAQAVAARTFLLRAMRDSSSLGRTAPIQNSERFQTYAARATPNCQLATAATGGIVARYQGRLILANYVAGAFWLENGATGADPTHTERFVTYNKDLRGEQVRPTPLASTSHPDNRGCLSQNGSAWLARHGYPYPAILRYFYGVDVELDGADPPRADAPRADVEIVETVSASDEPRGGGAALAVLAAVAWGLT